MFFPSVQYMIYKAQICTHQYYLKRQKHNGTCLEKGVWTWPLFNIFYLPKLKIEPDQVIFLPEISRAWSNLREISASL